jgi:NAD+ synthase
MDYDRARSIIVNFIRSKVKEADSTGVVIGLSGGIDSAVTSNLAVEALGSENVLGIHLPEEGATSPKDSRDSEIIANSLGINFKNIDISGIINCFISEIPDEMGKNPPVVGNLKSRIRMCLLYYYANSFNKMVVGTGNKSEIMLGYFTKYGDGGVDLEPIGDLYKTEVFELAKLLSIPEHIINKKPSAGLWSGQTDENELGLPYEIIDRILDLVSHGEKPENLQEIFDLTPEQIDLLLSRMKSNIHKRKVPPIAIVDAARHYME